MWSRSCLTEVPDHPVTLSYLPMAPTLVRAPFHRDGWVYEEKVDGRRMLAYEDDERVRLVRRNGRDHTRRFHDLARANRPGPCRAALCQGG